MKTLNQEQLAIETLRALKLYNPKSWRHLRGQTLLATISAAVVVFVVAGSLEPGQPKQIVQAGAVVSAFIAFLLGYAVPLHR